MTYSPAIGWAIVGVAAACFLFSAPPWMFLLTGLAAVFFGILGVRQRRIDAAAERDGEGRPTPP